MILSMEVCREGAKVSQTCQMRNTDDASILLMVVFAIMFCEKHVWVAVMTMQTQIHVGVHQFDTFFGC